MVKLIQPHECDHQSCPGDLSAPTGTFGGTRCLCRCHPPHLCCITCGARCEAVHHKIVRQRDAMLFDVTTYVCPNKRLWSLGDHTPGFFRQTIR